MLLGYYEFSDVKFKLENNKRHGLINHIYLCDIIPVDDTLAKIHKDFVYNPILETESEKFYYIKKIGELDFWQEISGFFHSSNKKVFNCGTSIDVPDDIELLSAEGPSCAGDYVVDEDYNVYRVYGWDNQNNSDIYFDFLDGVGSAPLTRLIEM